MWMSLAAWGEFGAAMVAACSQSGGDDAQPTADARSTVTTTPTLEAATLVPIPEASATPTESMTTLEATVWADHPQVPILTYHRFLPDTYAQSTAVKTRLADLQSHLERLYDSGYSLVPLGSWLAGDLRAPAGRRPLILTIDDAFFADQVSLTESGDPTPTSGIGVLWDFYREHPDFGFSAALFANLGDKLFVGGEEALATTIAWCLDHGVIPYNHFYAHPRLDLTETRWITWEAQKNDLYLRELLASVGRSDLTSKLGNILALPYGIWPESQSGRDAVLGYVNPEGTPLQAVMEVDYAYRARLAAAPYSEDFDRLHVPRIVATLSAIKVLEEWLDTLPAASLCEIRIEDASTDGSEAWEERIESARLDGCGPGIYVIGHSIYDALGTDVKRVFSDPSPGKGSCGDGCSD